MGRRNTLLPFHCMATVTPRNHSGISRWISYQLLDRLGRMGQKDNKEGKKKSRAALGAWLRRNWLAIIDLILIGFVGLWQGCTAYGLNQMEKTHVPMEEIIPTFPATAYHSNLSELYQSDIVFSYSGEKLASYFVEWYVVNSEQKQDNIAPKRRQNSEAISIITEADGRKTEVKEFEFVEEDEYTITATIYYYTGTPAGIREEQAKEYIKINGDSKQIQHKVVVEEKA